MVSHYPKGDLYPPWLVVPAGTHEIVFTFDPDTLHTTETIANIANLILLLSAIGAIALHFRERRKQKCNSSI